MYNTCRWRPKLQLTYMYEVERLIVGPACIASHSYHKLFCYYKYRSLDGPLCLSVKATKQRCEKWWVIGRFGVFRAKAHGFEFRSGRHVGTLGKSFTRSCLWRFGATGTVSPTQYPCCVGSVSE